MYVNFISRFTIYMQNNDLFREVSRKAGFRALNLTLETVLYRLNVKEQVNTYCFDTGAFGIRTYFNLSVIRNEHMFAAYISKKPQDLQHRYSGISHPL